jgi:hypothetical protein
MYVMEKYRALGVAKQIIRFLLDQTHGKKVYCIPFAHLRDLYQSFGFAECTDFDNVPVAVVGKYEWCKKRYDQDVLLLNLRASASEPA